MVRIYSEKSYWYKFDSNETVDRVRRHRKRSRLQLIIDDLQSKANKMDLVLETVIFREKSDSNSFERFKLDKFCFTKTKKIDKNRLAFKTQKARDLCNISQRKYFLFRQIMEFDTDVIAPDHSCNRIKKILDSMFPTVKNNYGFYLKDPIKKIKMGIECYIKKIQNDVVNENIDKIGIKFQADGTELTSKNMKHLNYTFSIVNDEKNAMSANGNFILGMYKIDNEDHETLKNSLEELKKMLIDLKTIEINSKSYEIEQFNSGDYKELALIYGINAANSNMPCVHCLWNKNERLDINRKYRKRNLKDAHEQYTSKQNGYVREPLTYIEFDHAIPCMLHCKTR
jgi:hypothetical protein